MMHGYTMRYIFREVAYCIIMLIHRVKTKGLIVGFRAKATLKSTFEGQNKLGHHSYFSGYMGYASYIGSDSIISGRIGRYCSIADRVVCLTYTHPVKTNVSTHPAFYSLKKQSGFTYTTRQMFEEEPKISGSDESIIIGNDVYIGYGATIIGPVTIGDGAVIAANATVASDVKPYTVVGGTPAKTIRTRFPDEIIQFLLGFSWWNKSNEWLRKHVEDFQDVNEFIKKANMDD